MIGETRSGLRERIRKLVREYHERFPPRIPDSLVPVSGKIYGDEELVNLVDAALDGWWTDGRFGQEFSDALSLYLGLKEVILANSGSSANLVAFMTLTSPLLSKRRILPGDEVICTAAAFPTTVNPILQAGCVPVFVDVRLETHNIDTTMLEAALSPKTKAVFIAHTLGNPFDLAAVKAFCEQHGLWLIEDCCDALGSQFDGRPVGTFGDLATFSFYPAHQITTGEGGAVVTDNALLAKIARSFRDWGRDCWCPTGKDNTCGARFNQQHGTLPFGYDHKYVYSHLGYNLKLTDFQAAIGVAQIKRLPSFVERRKQNHAALSAFFTEKGFDRFFILPEHDERAKPSWFGFTLVIKDGAPFTRAELLAHLNKEGVQTRLVFAGNVTRQPYFVKSKYTYRVVGGLANTDKIMNDAFWVGVYPGIDDSMIKRLCASFESFLAAHKDAPR